MNEQDDTGTARLASYDDIHDLHNRTSILYVNPQETHCCVRYRGGWKWYKKDERGWYWSETGNRVPSKSMHKITYLD